MGIRWRALAILMAPIALVPAAATAPLKPSEKWVVNFDDSQCVASRNYGTKDEPLFLALKAPPLGDVMQVSVIEPGTGGRYAKQVEARIATDAGPPIQTKMLSFALNDLKQRIYRINLPLAQFASVRTASQLTIVGENGFSTTFALSQLQPLMKILDECVMDLRKEWNVHTGEGHSPLLRQNSKGDLQGLLKGDDYPEIATSKMEQGDVRVVILVNEKGLIADCTVVQTSLSPVLDAQTCAIIKERARFEPAIGIDGRPAKSAHAQRVRWVFE